MTCQHCGTALPAGAMFCGECGRPVSTARAENRVATPPPPPVAANLIAPELPPLPDVGEEPRGAGWCAQCGALMSASEIFCGECGFVRAPARMPSTAARDTAILDPFPWGAAPSVANEPVGTSTSAGDGASAVDEAAASGIAEDSDPSWPLDPVVGAVIAEEEPAAAPQGLDTAGPDADVDADEDLEATRIVAPGARGDRFVLQFSTGESVSVTGSGLLGRNPAPEPGEYFDALVAISDPGRSVSKTHLEFGQEGGAFWISDRYSGNGTVLREPERPARRCEPGKRYRLVRGSRVEIGEQFFIVS